MDHHEFFEKRVSKAAGSRDYSETEKQRLVYASILQRFFVQIVRVVHVTGSPRN